MMAETPWTPQTGTLKALVYRGEHGVVYLEHSGAHPLLELDAYIFAGGDWNEACVMHEDEPPEPPKEVGLWELTYPWREPVPPTAEEKADPDYDGGDDETMGGEICCLWINPPLWTKVVPAAASAPAGVADSRVDPLTAQEIDEAFEIVCLPTLQGRTVEYIQNYGKDPATVREVALARALPAAGVSEDTARLDWLETMVVNVRLPLVHGSRDVFWSTPNFEEDSSDIRKAIDAARAARRPAPTRPEGTDGMR